MKLYVKRNQYDTFEKAKIENVSVEEWSVLQMALSYYIDEMKEEKCDLSDDMKIRSLYEEAVKVRETLKVKNEVAWK